MDRTRMRLPKCKRETGGMILWKRVISVTWPTFWQLWDLSSLSVMTAIRSSKENRFAKLTGKGLKNTPGLYCRKKEMKIHARNPHIISFLFVLKVLMNRSGTRSLKEFSTETFL